MRLAFAEPWRKYGKILRVSLVERMAYRADFFLSTILRFLPMLTTILLWHAVYVDAKPELVEKFSLDEMIPYLLSYRVAHKMAYIVMSALPYALLFWLCRDYLPAWPDWPTFAGYVVALLLAFLIGFFFEATIGMIGFWFLEVGSFLYVINTLSFFVSGHMFPLDLLPAPWDSILKSLPFSYLAYFPA